jgi:hypothetical protein
MNSDEKTFPFQIGELHITLHNKWQKFEYMNKEGAEGWIFQIGFISFWGKRR